MHLETHKDLSGTLHSPLLWLWARKQSISEIFIHISTLVITVFNFLLDLYKFIIKYIHTLYILLGVQVYNILQYIFIYNFMDVIC